ncbi:MAG: SDR family oxidoreductase [Dehalococcoidia bacterium]|nr:SDR family oxidoreductase [Dehalococcoidia bacterium]
MDLELSGKTAVVTGGSRGIGKAIARELALEGVELVVSARTLEPLKATALELSQETGRRVVPVQVDTGDDESVRGMVRTAAEALGHLDILVNCAAQPGGTVIPPTLSEITDDHFWSDMNIKVLGYLRCAREIAPYMRQQGWGRIINISGLAARQSGNTIGSMRNVSLVAMTKNLADELGSHGINVTVVHPGMTRTEKTPNTLENQAQRLNITIEEAERRMADGNSVRQIIDARDIAYVAAFLASPRSIAINGDVIAAGGGTVRSIYY